GRRGGSRRAVARLPRRRDGRGDRVGDGGRPGPTRQPRADAAADGHAVNVLVFGAHPDDPDFKAGGVAYLYGRAGHRVKFVSMTNGDAGHHQIGGVELARRRREETRAVARVLGLVEYQVLDNHDGELEPTLPNRRQVIRTIREFEPDLILAPRPNDYHPDHRYASQLVQDAAYMVTVPNIVALTDHLRRNPVIA